MIALSSMGNLLNVKIKSFIIPFVSTERSDKGLFTYNENLNHS